MILDGCVLYRITDALVAANDHRAFCGKKMSEAIDDMDAYVQLTDEVFQQILQSTDDKMKKVKCNFVFWFLHTQLTCNFCLLFLL